jgi:hypothetical protein
MDWELVKPWVNRVSIVLEFLSFWLAAPEILGEEQLRALGFAERAGSGLPAALPPSPERLLSLLPPPLPGTGVCSKTRAASNGLQCSGNSKTGLGHASPLYQICDE